MTCTEQKYAYILFGVDFRHLEFQGLITGVSSLKVYSLEEVEQSTPVRSYMTVAQWKVGQFMGVLSLRRSALFCAVKRLDFQSLYNRLRCRPRFFTLFFLFELPVLLEDRVPPGDLPRGVNSFRPPNVDWSFLSW